jgi:hypothetical protein
MKKPASWPAFSLPQPDWSDMRAYREKSFDERMKASSTAKKATLQRFLNRPGADDPAVIAQKARREAVVAARDARLAARQAAKTAAEEQERAAAEERALREQREAAEKAVLDAARAVALAAEQKAARDARYAARKARK